ncbi:hypothetical protein CYMTET_28608 [Cymbomonas tetramitiformis]|uniref:Uncharacterized protein n=1 Tax=Cymbomonas tetramitiformis TaxID=36881 RepID=A0AAE0KVR0_9CHLO|nr:hypothetical protein CYMTET_28608 [Cymbomonas tetramitiformis]
MDARRHALALSRLRRARRDRVSKAVEERLRREVGKREREQDSTEVDEASEERLPGEAETEARARGAQLSWAEHGRPLAAVTIEDVIVEFVLERTKSSQCRLVELVQYVGGSEVGTPTHFVRPMTWNSPSVTVLEKIQRTLEDAEEVEAYVWLDFLAVNHHTTTFNSLTQQHEVVDYADLSEYDSKAKMGTTVEIPPPATVFKVSIARSFGERWSTVTTEEVVQEFVVPRTEATRCRLVDMSEYVAAEAVGRPSYFISHAWKGAFATLFNRVLEFLASASDETRVWVDVFAVNQHREALHQQNRQDVMAFEDVVEHCVGTIVVVDMARMNPATRACSCSSAPTNVRFVITARPDAVCSQIEPLLGRVFVGSVTLLRPEALRSGAAAEHGAQGTGVLMYHTVAKECAALGDSWGKDHADLGDVYSAYRRVFASALAELSAEDQGGVLELLEALLAAQKPLAESSLQRMGLAGTLPRLPGWGCLFYVAEHHVYLLHKSLSDWLLQESQALGSIPQSAHSEVSYVMLRWLRLVMHELERNPCLEHFASKAWGAAPLGSMPHRKAAEHTARRTAQVATASGDGTARV